MPGRDAYDLKNRRIGAKKGSELDASRLFVSSRSREDAERAARIAALKAQIDAGTYRPDLEKVAERLLPDLMRDIS